MFEIFDRPHADPSSLPLATSAWPVCIIIGSYLLFVLKLGRQLMANREPFQLRGALEVYNIIQIVYNTVLLLVALPVFFLANENYICLKVVPLDSPYKSWDRMICYLYYLNKIIDLMDTIFMVLRKNYKQISVLHLVHHVSMVLPTYFAIRIYGYGGHFLLMGGLNTFVHIVMYSYYYLSAQRTAIKRSLWWKKYITILQLVQFILMFSHSFWTLMNPNCLESRSAMYLVIFMSSLMFVMFTNFYIHAYVLPKKKITLEEKLN